MNFSLFLQYHFMMFVSNCNAFSFDIFWILFILPFFSAWLIAFLKQMIFNFICSFHSIGFFSSLLHMFLRLRMDFIRNEYGLILIALDEWWNNYNYGYYWFDQWFLCVFVVVVVALTTHLNPRLAYIPLRIDLFDHHPQVK